MFISKKSYMADIWKKMYVIESFLLELFDVNSFWYKFGQGSVAYRPSDVASLLNSAKHLFFLPSFYSIFI